MRCLVVTFALVGCAQAGQPFSNGAHNTDGGTDDAPGQPIDAPSRPIDAPGSGSGSGSGSNMGPTTITLRQNTADTPISLGIGCNDSQETVKNEFYRVFDLSALNITTDFTVTKVSFAVESYDGAGDIDVSAIVGTYTGTISNNTLTGTFSPVGSPTPANVSNGSDMMVDVPMSETIPGGSQLYIEVVATAGVDDTFFLGANTAGETATGYVQNKANQCGQGSPTNATTADGGTTNLIMNVTGTY